MGLIYFCLIVLPGLISLAFMVDTLKTRRKVPYLATTQTTPEDQSPKLSLIVPACNEEKTLDKSLHSLKELNYSNLEIILVNDRSQDKTAQVMKQTVKNDSRFQYLEIKELPKDWLGKTHALAQGLEEANGDWVLFTDADVQFSPEMLNKALSYAQKNELDFLSVLPEILPSDFLGDSAYSVFGLMMTASRLWEVKDPKSEAVFGLGAFLLFRRSAYNQTSGLEWLKLEVSDDVGLCLLFKKAGFKCDIVNGLTLLSLSWYPTFPDMVEKMQKNWFGILGRFSLWRCCLLASLFLWLALYPLLALLPGVPFLHQVIAFVGWGSLVSSSLAFAHWSGRKLFPALFPQVGMLLVSYMIMRSGIIGSKNKGIQWRSTFYSSRLLKEYQRVKL